MDAGDLTLRAYERSAAEYAERTPRSPSPLVSDLLELVEPGARVLELGTGPGRDAAALEKAGLRVDRTDGASAFVDRLRAEGHAARVLDIRSPDFGGPYDAVFANAVFLHLRRKQLSGVLEVARRSTREGGVLAASLKKGSGEGWSAAKLDEPRFFTYWDEAPLEEALVAAGWTPIRIFDATRATSTEPWITVLARH